MLYIQQESRGFPSLERAFAHPCVHRFVIVIQVFLEGPLALGESLY